MPERAPTRRRLVASLLAAALLAAAATACETDTSRLTVALQQRFAVESTLRHAENVVFRYTHDAGTRAAGWEERVGSILVTTRTVYIHKNEKVGLEITPAGRRAFDVARDHDRVRIGAGSGKSREVWSFVPPDDAAGWTADIRSVIRAARPAR
jgi:hypothetical protein